MDEAERCHRIVYLANGHIVVQGDAGEVSRRSGLITFEVTGEDIDDAARRLRRMPGVEAAAVFGRALHVAGTDRAALESAIRAADGDGADGETRDGAKLDGARLSWQEVEPRLEDVFIHMLSMDQNRRPSP
jgi:ABC-2 type transport system ATP-binding protein